MNAESTSTNRFSPVVSRPEAFMDAKTGLMISAADIDRKCTFEEAKKAVSELRCGGYSDWRLPTFDELNALVDRTRFNPAADPALIFKPDWYWTASPLAADSGCTWIVYFNHGISSWSHQNSKCCVRAVRSASQ